MKKLFTLFLFVFGFISFTQAQIGVKYLPAKVVCTDGTIKEGFAEAQMGNKYLHFKKTEKATPEKIENEKLAHITYTMKGKKYEYEQLKVYLGWKQKRISDKIWLKVVERGIATLYVKSTTMGSASNPNSAAGFLDYYIIRKGEPAAKMIANISSMNNNQTFRAKAPLYFSDYPELAHKIKSKEYKWKDLIPVVKKYNEWAAQHKD